VIAADLAAEAVAVETVAAEAAVEVAEATAAEAVAAVAETVGNYKAKKIKKDEKLFSSFLLYGKHYKRFFV
jgi:hypothetical protein